MSNLLLYAIPGFLLSLWLERWWASRQAPGLIRGYETRDTLASLGMGVGNVIISAFSTLGAVALWQAAFEHRLLDLGRSKAVWAWLVLFVSEDLCYYWFHRAHHEVRLLWAAHVNHHSSQYFNLSTALRQPWFTPFTGPVFWLPLTPSHHRVHHGKNVAYLDRNHGGVLIVWDRLFGTFQAEEEPVLYGLTHDITTRNPLRIAVHEWLSLGRDLRRSASVRQMLGHLLAAPGWSPDGTSLTAKQQRRAKQAESRN